MEQKPDQIDAMSEQDAKDELRKLLATVLAHNTECAALCDEKKRCGYHAYARHCGDCTKDYMIDIDSI